MKRRQNNRHISGMQQNQILDYFVDCHRLRDRANRLRRQVDLFREMAMNSSISSGQIGSDLRLFSELARQINSNSEQMDETLAELLVQTTLATNKLLRAFSKTLMLEKFDLALSYMDQNPNKDLVREARGNVSNNILQTMVSAEYTEIRAIQHVHHRLVHLSKRMWVTVVNLRMAGRNLRPDEETQFLPIIEAIHKGLETFDAELADLISATNLVKVALHGQEFSGQQEALHAA